MVSSVHSSSGRENIFLLRCQLHQRFNYESESDTDFDGSENSDDLLEEITHNEDNIEEMRKEVEFPLNVSVADKSVLKFLQNCDEVENCEYSEEISKHCDTDIVANSKTDENSLVRPQDDHADLTEISSQFKQVHDKIEARSVTAAPAPFTPTS